MREGGRDGPVVHADRPRDDDHGGQVVDVVPTDERRCESGLLLPDRERDARSTGRRLAEAPIDGLGGAVGGELRSIVRDDVARATEVLVVTVHEEGPRAGHACRDGELLAQDPVERSETLEVARADGGDDREIGSRDATQACDLAGLARADLEHEDLRVLLEPGHRERHPDAIVVASDRRHAAKPRAEHGAEGVLRGGLAVASGDRHDGAVEAVAQGSREIEQRVIGALDRDHRTAALPRSIGEDRGRTGTERLGQEIAAPVRRAVERDEQIARGHPARVGRDPPDDERRVTVADPAAGRDGHVFEAHRDHGAFPRVPSRHAVQSSTTSRSE